MYSFAQRSDTAVLDEPLYGHYLRRTGAQHPGRQRILATVECQASKVIQQEMLGEHELPVLFVKSMAHHLVGLDLSFLDSLTNIILIRRPEEVLASLYRHLAQPTLLDTAFKMQYELLHFLQERGQTPLVIDARDLLSQPENLLRQVCLRVGLNFEPAMLHWQAGALPQDGVWAPYWYDSLHQTTGFEPYLRKPVHIPERLTPLLEESYEYYLALYEHALQTHQLLGQAALSYH